MRSPGVDTGHLGAVHLGEIEEEAEMLALGLAQWALRLQVDRLAARLGLVLRRADLDAEPAAGAVLGRHLEDVLHPLEVRRLVGTGAEPLRRAVELRGRADLGADGGVRAD